MESKMIVPSQNINGDIIFRTPDMELLRLRADGAFLVKGKVIATDEEVYQGFREWLGIARNAGGNVTIQSGKGVPVGDITIDSGSKRDQTS